MSQINQVFDLIPLAKWTYQYNSECSSNLVSEKTHKDLFFTLQTPPALIAYARSPATLELFLTIAYGMQLDLYCNRKLSSKHTFESRAVSICWTNDAQFLAVGLENGAFQVLENSFKEKANECIPFSEIKLNGIPLAIQSMNLASEETSTFAVLVNGWKLLLLACVKNQPRVLASFCLSTFYQRVTKILWHSQTETLYLLGPQRQAKNIHDQLRAWKVLKDKSEWKLKSGFLEFQSVSPQMEYLQYSLYAFSEFVWCSVIPAAINVTSMELSVSGKYYLVVNQEGFAFLISSKDNEVIQEFDPKTFFNLSFPQDSIDGVKISSAQFVSKLDFRISLLFNNGFFVLGHLALKDKTWQPLFSQVFFPESISMSIFAENLYILEKESQLNRIVYRDGSHEYITNTRQISKNPTRMELLEAFTAWMWFSSIGKYLKSPNKVAPKENVHPIEFTYQLTCLLSMTPKEFISRKIAQDDFDTALDVAEQNQISQDDIYLKKIHSLLQIRHREIDFSYFDKIVNRKLILEFCLIPQVDPSKTRSILEYGLHQTDSLTAEILDIEIDMLLEEEVSNEGDAPSAVDQFIFRRKFLQILDKLDYFESIFSGCHEDSYFQSKFKIFCKKSDSEICKELAREGQISALKLILPQAKNIDLKEIFFLIPDYIDVSQYEPLLPGLDIDGNELTPFSSGLSWREADWTEDSKYTELIEFVSSDLNADLRDDKNLSYSWYEWYLRKIKRIEGSSGLVDKALNLARVGLKKGFKDLEPIEKNLTALNTMVFSDIAPKLLDFSLERLELMAGIDLLRSVILLADMTNICPYFSSVVIPCLSLLPEPFLQLTNLFLDMCKKDLTLIVAISREASIIKDFHQFATIIDLKNLFMDCAYAYELSDGDQDLENIADFIASTSTTENDWETDLHPEIYSEDFKEKCTLFKAHIATKAILSFYNISKPLHWVKEDLPRNSELVFKELLRFPKMSKKPDDLDSVWTVLLEHLIDLQSLGSFGALPKRKIYWDLLSITLREGRIKLSKSILFPKDSLPPLPMHDIERLLLETSQEFFDNSDSGDKSKGYMKIAQNILHLYPQKSILIQSELNLIDATHILTTSAQGRLDVLPIQIRLEPDRLIFVKSFISKNGEIFCDLQFLERLAIKLSSNCNAEEVKAKLHCILCLYVAENDSSSEMIFSLCTKISAYIRDLTKDEMKSLSTYKQCLEALYSIIKLESIDVTVKLDIIELLIPFCPGEDLSWILAKFEEISVTREFSKLQLEQKNANSKMLLQECQKNASLEAMHTVNLDFESFYGPLKFDDERETLFEKKLLELELSTRLNRYQSHEDKCLWDDTIVELSSFIYNHNISISIGFLLNLFDVKKSRQVFDKLHPSEENQEITAYYFSLQAILEKNKSNGKQDHSIHLSSIFYVLSETDFVIKNGSLKSVDTSKSAAATVSNLTKEKIKHPIDTDKRLQKDSSFAIEGWDNMDAFSDILNDEPQLTEAIELKNSQRSKEGWDDSLFELDIPEIEDDKLDAKSPDCQMKNDAVSANMSDSGELAMFGQKYAEEMKLKRQQIEIQEFLSTYGFEYSAFLDDADYRIKCLSDCVKTFDAEAFKKSMLMADRYGIAKDELVEDHIKGLLTSDLPISELSVLLMQDHILKMNHQRLLMCLIKFHSAITSNQKLFFWYDLIINAFDEETLKGHGININHLKNRVEFLKAVSHSQRSENSYSLSHIINSCLTTDHDSFAKAILNMYPKSWLQIIIMACNLPAIFPEEKSPDLFDKENFVSSTLCASLLMSSLNDFEPDDLISYIPYLKESELKSVISKLTLGAQSSKHSLGTRLKIVQTAIDQSPKNGTAKLEYESIRSHLQMIQNIISIQETHGLEIISLMELDDSYRNSVRKLEILHDLISKMISIDIIKAIYDAMSNTDANLPSLDEIYVTKLQVFLHQGSFKDADELLRSAVEFVSLNENLLESDAWGLDESFSCLDQPDNQQLQIESVEKSLKSALLDQLSRPFSIENRTIEQHVKHLLEKYFVLDVNDSHLITNAENNFVHQLWNTNDLDLSSNFDKILKLTPLSNNKAQLQYLIDVCLAELNLAEVKNVNDLVLPLSLKVIDYDPNLFLKFRLQLAEKKCLFEDHNEHLILNALQRKSRIHYIKHGFLSSSPITRQDALTYLEIELDVDPESCQNDPILHSLICARGFAPVFTSSDLWPFIMKTLTQIASLKSTEYRPFFTTLISDILQSGQYIAAASVASQVVEMPKELKSGIHGWMAILTGFSGKSAPSELSILECSKILHLFI